MTDPIDPDVPELAGLPGESPPPAHLERRVVAALRREGLLSASRPGGAPWKAAWISITAAAAAAVLVGSGWWLGSRSAGGAVPEEPNFVLLLREDESFRTAPADQEMDRVAEYKGWAFGEHEHGAVVGGMKLGEEAAVLAGPGHDGGARPESRLPGGVAGLFLVRARDMPEARELAESCPHLRYGGIIEVRPIEGS